MPASDGRDSRFFEQRGENRPSLVREAEALVNRPVPGCVVTVALQVRKKAHHSAAR